jgi:hypothetical protein
MTQGAINANPQGKNRAILVIARYCQRTHAPQNYNTKIIYHRTLIDHHRPKMPNSYVPAKQ